MCVLMDIIRFRYTFGTNFNLWGYSALMSVFDGSWAAAAGLGSSTAQRQAVGAALMAPVKLTAR
jgi:hypothetical protein